MITQAKKIELINKHAKKFAAKKYSGRPILEGVHYAANGTVFVTNSYYALCIRDAHSFTEPFTSHVVTGAPIDGAYPNIRKVIPTKFSHEIILSEKINPIKEVLQKVKWATEIAKLMQEPVTTLVIDNGAAFLQVKHWSIEYRAQMGSVNCTENGKWALNPEYLFNALNVFKDAGTNILTIRLCGNMDPIVLSDDENGIDVLIIPIRISK